MEGIWIFSLIALCILLCNVGTSFIIRMYVLNKKRSGIKTDKLLSRFGLLEKVNYGCIILFSAVFSFLFYQIGEAVRISVYLLALIPFIYIIIQLLVTQMLFHGVHKQLRQTETTVKEDVLHYVKMLSIMFLPAILLIFFRVYFLQQHGDREYVFYLILLAGIALFTMLYPYLIKIMMRGEPIKSAETHHKLQQLLDEQHIKNTSLYQFKSKKSKLANAMIVGVLNKKIFFSDYLLEHLTNEEVQTILAHELGHLKKNHLFIKGILFIALLPMFIGVGYGMDYFEQWSGIHIPIPIGVMFMLGGMILYIGFIFLKLSKIQEYQADRYVMEIGLDEDVFINALQKMTTLNDQLSEAADLGELLGTHPSLENRIKQIQAYRDSRE